MKALTLDQAGDVRDDVEPLVLRAIELDGELTIVPVPEDHDLSIEELKELARWRRDSPPQGRESGGAVRERSERTRAECPEARERRSRRKRPPEAGADPEARPQGGPSGADLVKRCGAEAVAVAVYILHLRESTPRSEANHRDRRLAGDSL